MDVYPPHQPLHGWKDFWIHLGTITIGLLIALGLEAAAEWAHRAHERNDLVAALATQSMHNEYWIEQTHTRLQGDEVVLHEALLSLQTGSAWPTNPLLPMLIPDTAVWDSAKANDTTVLLPTDRAQDYSDTFLREGWAVNSSNELKDRIAAIHAIELEADANATALAPPEKLSAAQKEKLISAIALTLTTIDTAKTHWLDFAAFNYCAPRGKAYDLGETCIMKYFKNHNASWQ